MDNKSPIDVNIFPLQTPASLAVRWGVDRSLVQKWKERHEDFPRRALGYVDGASSYYPIYEVERYERARGLNVTGNEYVYQNCNSKENKEGNQ